MGEADVASLRARKKLRTRDRIFDAAIELFADRPYAEVTVDEICERAEVGRATFFRFYGSKAGLLGEYSQRLAEHLLRRLDEATARGATAVERLWVVQDEIATAWDASGPATREMAKEWVRSSSASDLSQVHPPELVALVADIVRDGQATGELTTRYEADFVAWIVLASLSAVTAGWLHSEGDATLAQGTRDALSLLLTGLATDRPAE
ncbi:MAG TPA: TetR/AcrR family transcriptional regulator [Acidimicrobiales bacterium]